MVVCGYFIGQTDILLKCKPLTRLHVYQLIYNLFMAAPSSCHIDKIIHWFSLDYLAVIGTVFAFAYIGH